MEMVNYAVKFFASSFPHLKFLYIYVRWVYKNCGE
jgi:hypothetical protein